MKSPAHLPFVLVLTACGLTGEGAAHLTATSVPADGAASSPNSTLTTAGTGTGTGTGASSAGLIVSVSHRGTSQVTTDAAGIGGIAGQIALAASGSGSAGSGSGGQSAGAFVDTSIARFSALHLTGTESEPIGTLLGDSAATAADTTPLDTSSVDHRGYIYFPAAGVYTFEAATQNIGLGIFLDGSAASGSGTLIGELPATGGHMDANYTVAAAGWQPFELFWYHIYGGGQQAVALDFTVQGPRSVRFATAAGATPTAVASPGLQLSLWHRSLTDPQRSAALTSQLVYAAGRPPDATCIDTTCASAGNIILSGPGVGSSGPSTISLLGARLSGDAAFDPQLFQYSLADFSGTIHFPAAGTYTFTLSETDDFAGVWVDGDGTPGSGTLLVQSTYVTAASQSATLTVDAASARPFEFAYYNGPVNATISLNITGPAGVSFTAPPALPDASDLVVPPTASEVQVTLGPPVEVPIPAISDAGVFQNASGATLPYLPTADGQANMTFWSTGKVFRSQGADLWSMAAPSPNAAVLVAGASGAIDASGIWLSDVTRLSDQSLVGLYRANNDAFGDGGTGVWASSGVATSSDDGQTWTKLGEAVGLPQPHATTTGGRTLGCMLWDTASHTWLGLGGGQAFRSTVAVPVPGSWRSWDGAAFTGVEPDVAGINPQQVLGGLTQTMAECSVSYNAYLSAYVLIWRQAGSSSLLISTSQTFTTWNPPRTLYTPIPAGLTVANAFLIGPTHTTDATDQDNILVYQQTPGVHGRNLDTVSRTLHLGP